jgi:hypothetical protein
MHGIFWLRTWLSSSDVAQLRKIPTLRVKNVEQETCQLGDKGPGCTDRIPQLGPLVFKDESHQIFRLNGARKVFRVMAGLNNVLQAFAT